MLEDTPTPPYMLEDTPHTRLLGEGLAAATQAHPFFIGLIYFSHNILNMERCYIPAIILFILALVLAIQTYKVLYWTAPIVLGSIPLSFSILSWFLCKKGYKKLAWIAPLGALITLAVITVLM